VVVPGLFISSGGKQGGNYLEWRSQKKQGAASCYFNDRWRLNENRKKGAPSKEFAERERTCSALVAAYMASYDVSTNPMVAEGKKMISVQNRRRTQVEEWWHSSAGEAEDLRVANKWSA